MARPEPNVYRTCTPVVERHFDPQRGASLSSAVVEAIAAAADVGPTDLPPLYEVVDLDALTQLFSGDHAGSRNIFGFTFDEWQVFVLGDGRICVCDRTQPTDPEPLFRELD